ncbi:MAG: hypothetical protein IJN22_06530 [Clostridia bacterium]|nr:hypothetical protein [Clostridia bacterium]
MRKARLISSILEIVIGFVLCVCHFAHRIDEFWSGMGIALIIVGAIFLLRNIKYHKNEKYREEIDLQNNDERNKFISMKAWSWAGYLFVIIAAVGTMIFKFIGKEDLMMLSSGSICIVVFLYWISYMILHKKY